MKLTEIIHKALFADLKSNELDFKAKHFRSSLSVGVICYVIWIIFTYIFEKEVGDPLRFWCFLAGSSFLAVLVGSFYFKWVKKHIETITLLPLFVVMCHCLNAIIANPNLFSYWISNFMAFSICSMLLLDRKTILTFGTMVLLAYIMMPLLGLTNEISATIFMSISIIIHTLAVFTIIPQDIWSVKLLQEKNKEIEHLNKEQSIMVAQISHDLKTPLVSLVALMPKVKEMIEDPKGHKMLEIMMNSVSYIQSLTLQINTYHQVFSGEMKPQFEKLDLHVIAQNCINISAAASSEKQIRFSNTIDENTIIEGSKVLLEQVFINLIANSIKYNKSDLLEIAISSILSDNRIVIKIKDNGVGMNTYEAKKAFDLFYRADKSRTDLSSMGMGLSICKEILILHQSKIKVASSSPEDGTCIVFDFPTSLHAKVAS